MRKNTSVRMHLALAVMALLAAAPATAQQADSARLTLMAEWHHFFKDNEFSHDRLDGYTLPGFYFRPRLVWQVEPRVKLEAGVHWLNYWGAQAYPSVLSYTTAQPEWNDTNSAFHIMPWIQARVDLTPWLTLVMGSLENNDGHHLPTPLYNKELVYAGDPEAGVQMMINGKYLEVDTWADWRDFIFYHSHHQEQFYVGVSARLKYDFGRWQFHLPVYTLAQHTGGEGLDTPQLLHTKNNVNAATGLGATYTNGDFSAGLEVLALGYHQVRDSIIPFNNGWAFSPTLTVGYRGFELKTNYWKGHNFIPLMGSAHYSSHSTNTPTFFFHDFQVLTLSANYTLRSLKHCIMVAEAELVTYFPYTVDVIDWDPIERNSAMMGTFGIHLILNPTIRLLK